MNSFVLDALEPRRHLAANPYLDPAFGSGGVSTVRFRVSAADPAVTRTQLADGGLSLTYVMARTAKTVQVRRLDNAGRIDTTWFPEKHGLLVFPTTSTASGKIGVDAAGRLLVLAGRDLYRFNEAGTVDRTFGTDGRVTLGDFAGGDKAAIDFDVDPATNKVYATGPTAAGGGMLVERLISRGRFDKTFDKDGKLTLPLPAAAAKTGATAQGQKIIVLPDSPDDDDVNTSRVLVAGAVNVLGVGAGVQAVRLLPDGEIDQTYGRRGSAYVAGTARTDDGNTSHTVQSLVPNGTVSIQDYETDESGHTRSGDFSIFTAGRGAYENVDTGVDRSGKVFDDGYLGIRSGVARRFGGNNSVIDAFNGGRALTGVDDVVTTGIRDNLDVEFSSVATGGRVSVALFSDGIYPLTA